MDFSLITIFGAGLLTFASPCVLPLIPVYLATLAGGAVSRVTRARLLSLAAAFCAGLVLVFAGLGSLASSLGLVEHQRTISYASGALMIVFGLRALGLFRIAALDVDARPALHRIETASSLGGAFLFGAAFALGWSPCIGPVLASLLTYVAAHADTPWRGAGYLAVYALGIALPLLALAGLAGQATRWLKRVRLAIPVLERVTGVALLLLGVLSFVDLEPAPHAANTCEEDSHTCALGEVRGEDSVLHLEADGSARLLAFVAEDCPVCRRMQPKLDRFAASCRDLAPRVTRVDTGTPQGHALALRYGVRGTPTYVLLDERGNEVTRLVGAQSSEAVASAIEQTFGLSCWG